MSDSLNEFEGRRFARVLSYLPHLSDLRCNDPPKSFVPQCRWVRDQLMTTYSTPRENSTASEGFGRGAGVILLVEDDASVRNLASRLLGLHGFQVIVAENGRDALPIWERYSEEIDLLLTDVVMPHGVSGRDLANRCLADNQRLRVIYTSGYNMELSCGNDWLRDGVHFVQKPYHPDQLMNAVRAALRK